jgi:hypothetical protein
MIEALLDHRPRTLTSDNLSGITSDLLPGGEFREGDLSTVGDVVPIIPLLRTDRLKPAWKMLLLYVRYEIKV